MGYAPTLIEDVGFLLYQARRCVNVYGTLRKARSRCDESIMLKGRHENNEQVGIRVVENGQVKCSIIPELPEY